MNSLLKILNKYIVLLIIGSIFGVVWLYIQPLFMREGVVMTDFTYSFISNLTAYFDYLIRLVIAG